MEIVDKILHYVGQSTLAATSAVSREWHKQINNYWHTVDLSKSSKHFTHMPAKIKQEVMALQKKGTEKRLESIVANLVANYGFLVPGSGGSSPPLFGQKNTKKTLQEEIEKQLQAKIDAFFLDLPARYGRVEVLDLSGCSNLKLDSLVTLVLAFAPTLVKLMTRRCKSPTLTDVEFARGVVANAPKLKTLYSLGLARCSALTSEGIQRFSTSPTTKNMRTIGLNYMSQLSDASIRSLGTACTNLTIFSLSNIKHLTSDTLAKIALSCPKMGSFDISGCDKTDDFVMEAIAINCRQLFQLNISKCHRVSSHAIAHVAQHCKKIRILFLSNTMVDDDSMHTVIENLHLEVLISIGCQNLTDKSVQRLFDIGNERLCKMLINLSLCNNISQSLIGVLQHLTKPQYTPGSTSGGGNALATNNLSYIDE
eukprot:gene3786-4366_t